ncbi:MAG TPA: RHS repeat-associated core domain-containing protein [Pyrinomonadaceae bacterium]|jgi:RHS repeat-associated protein
MRPALNRKSRPFRSLIAASLLAATLLMGVAQAQTVTSPERGYKPGNSYAISDIETIEQQGGNLMLNVPLGSLPAGRGGISAGISLHYNSKIWDSQSGDTGYPDYITSNEIVPSAEGGWRYGYKYKLIDNSDCDGGYKYSIELPDGSQHLLWADGNTNHVGALNFGLDGTPNCGNPTVVQTQSGALSLFTLDGTRLRVEMDGDGDGIAANNRWTLYLPDGTRVIHNPDHVANPETGLLQRIIDRNNNTIDFIESSSDSAFGNRTTTTIKDALNRKVVIEKDRATNQDWIHSTGFNGAALVTKVQWKTITVRRTYRRVPGGNNCTGCSYYHTLSTNFRVVDKVYLPAQAGAPNTDDLFYTFDYNADAVSNPSAGWGEVSGVTLPSGAYSTYSYTENGSSSSIVAYDILQNRPAQKTLNYLKENDGASQLATDTWTYSKSGGTYTTVAPDGGTSSEIYDLWGSSGGGNKYVDGATKPVKSIAADGSIIERVYANNIPADSSVIGAANQFVKYEITSITNSAGTLSKTAIKEYSQDKNGNMTQVKEYDFVPYSGTGSVPRDSNGRPTGLPSGITPARISVTNYYNDVPDSASTTYTDTDSYHLSGNPRLLRLVKSTEVQDGSSTPKARTEITYDYTNYSASNTVAGNPTATKTWDSYKGGTTQAHSNPLTTSNSISTSTAYDSYGNPTSTTDARGTVTQLTYGNVSTPGGNVTGLYPTQTVSGYGTSIAQTANMVYDFSTGLVTQSTIVGNNTNENIVNQSVYDDLGRPITVKAAVGTAQERWTQTVYGDDVRRVIAKTDLYAKQDAQKIVIQHFDQLGRVRLARQIENPATEDPTNAEHGIKVQTRYLTSGACTYNSNKTCSFQLASNPYRASTSGGASSETTMGWTRSQTQADGKHSEAETFSGSALPAPFVTSGANTASTGVVKTDTDGERTLVTDQALKQRISKTNALGQLINVWEVRDWDASTVSISFPNQSLAYAYETSYSYDTLSNLTGVTQGGQTRTFSYSSLSRLKSAANPESGTINYTYDNGGNLLTKTDARSLVTTYSYDALNRLQTRSYSGTTPATPTVTYTYDDSTVAFSKGKLTKVYSTVSETQYTAFDAVGNLLSSQQITEGQPYPFTYKYNLSGALTEETYPSGRVVRNLYDASGDLAAVSGRVNVTNPLKSYAGNFSYNPAGGIDKMQLGNTRWETMSYNARLQLTQIGLGTSATDTSLWKAEYSYGELNTSNGTVDAAKNNGNLAKQIITAPNATSGQSAVVFTQSYIYDHLNRLKSGTEMNGSTQNWKQTFLYDRFGNRTFDTANNNTTTLAQNCTTALCNPSANTSDNKFYTSNGYGYDSAGNMTGNAAGESFVYDGEIKQVKYFAAGNANNGTNQPNATYGYDGGGKRVRKTTATENTVFVYDAFGKLAAEYNVVPQSNQTASTKYLTQDTLGSPRVITNQSGTVESRRDFMPFGEEIASGVGGRSNVQGYGAADNVRQKFTTYERDNESGLDYAVNRYHSASLGRFTSPDPYNIVLEKEKGRDEQERQKFLITYIAQPQIWNKYCYTLNNPLKHTDPDGRRPINAADRSRIDRFIQFGNERAAEIEREKGKEAADAFRQSIQQAANAIENSILAIPDNAKEDPKGLRALFYAIDKLGDVGYSTSSKNTAAAEKKINSNGWSVSLPASANKCNIFIAAAYVLGANIGFRTDQNPGGYQVNSATYGRGLFGYGNVPTSGDILQNNMANFTRVNAPAPGDVVADPQGGEGHVGISAGGGNIVVSANLYTGVRVGTMDSSRNVYLRYKP